MISGLLLGLLKGMAQAPVANFSASPTTGCGPLVVQFKDLSTNNPGFWSWDFGDGATSSVQNPAHTYGGAGTFTVKLIVRNSAGADAIQKTDYITVYPYPTPALTSNLTLACAPANIQFTDLSKPGQGSITSWAWDLGDGSTSNQQDPAHTYTSTGYYTISLRVTNSGGCANTTTASRYLRVVDGIQPNFAFDQSSTSCTAPFNGQLLNQSAGPGNLTFSWTMGNGAVPSSSTDTSPIVSFPNNATYPVNLLVTSSLGCSASLQKNLPFSNNSAILNGPTTACVNSPVTFTDGSNPLPPSIRWDFGDGTGSTVSSPSKTYPATGSYIVKLVNKYTGCADSTTTTVNVVPPPTPDFTVTPSPASACKPSLAVTFTDQTSPTPSSWSWDFGDGQTSTQQSPSHTYTAPGTFNVKLTVMGAGGCSNTITKNAAVTIQAPTVSIGGVLANCTAGTPANNTINPTANVNSVDGVTGYSWSAPNSTELNSTSATPTFHYPNPGTYQLQVTITSTGGCTATATTNVQIGTPTTPAFTINPNPVCGNSTVTFTTTSTPADQYHWDFGDMTNSGALNQPTATHIYRALGTQNVTLTLTHAGCPTAVTEPVTIQAAIPNFGYHVDCSVSPLNVVFTDTSLTDASLVSYTWDYGDGNTQVITAAPWTPPHVYAAPGVYTVTLTILDGTCTTTFARSVTIGQVTPDFTMPSSACQGVAFPVISTSTVSSDPPGLSFIAGYTWNVGGIPYPEGSSWAPNGNDIGPLNVSLTVTDANGCNYTSPVKTIYITGPTALYAFPAIGGGCKNVQTIFQDQSTPYPGSAGAPPSPIVSRSWNWGDGITTSYPPSSPPYEHVYADTGNYTIILTVTDAAGCSAVFGVGYLPVTSPIPNFSGPDSFYCPGVPLTFVDSSLGYGPLTENWNFGDGNTSTTPVNTFANSGQTYNVTLTVTDKYGCISAITKPVRIQKPIAAFNIYDTTAICAPLQTILAAHGQYYDSLYWDFGDNTTSTLDSTSHFYNDFGIDTAKLFLQGPGGCLDSASRRVLIINPYTATGFTYSPLSHCDSVPVQFNLIPPSFTQFTLLYGDNTADSSQNRTPFHNYKLLGSYLPVLALTDETGCIVDISGPPGPITVLGATPFFSVDKPAFCDSSIVNFTDYSISDDGYTSETYTFGDGSPNQSINPGTGTFNVSNYYNQIGDWTATLTVSTNSGCSETYKDTIRVFQTPHPQITVPNITCTGLIQFQGSITTPKVDTISWDWNFGNGQTSTQQNPSSKFAPGNYEIILKAATSFGCSDTTSADITVHPLPEIKGPGTITTPLGIPITIPFTYSSDIVTYNWTPTSNLDCPTCPNPAATLIFSTTYTVTVTDDNNCTATDTILIKTICNADNYFFPNTFSPNGDGVNDYFYPRGTSLYNIQSLTIFNRWGQMVFQRRDFPANAQNMGWDGNFAGRPAPADAYVYIAEVVCDNAQIVVLHGNVTLVR